jgi:hypothetical protein
LSITPLSDDAEVPEIDADLAKSVALRFHSVLLEPGK